MLTDAGYELLVARNGDEALTMARQHSGMIDLLLTDVVMPRMNGFELGELIANVHPETNMLFVSGYFHDSASVRRGLRTAGQAFLLKPFTQVALLGKIQEVLQHVQVARSPQLTAGDARTVPEADGGRLGARGAMGFQPGAGIVVREDGFDRFALPCLDDGARLTQPDAVAEPLTREENPVGLLFHAEACAAECARTELAADDGAQALSPNHCVFLASHADTGCPARGVTSQDCNLVETLPDRGVRGGVENTSQMVAIEGQSPVVSRSNHAKAVADTGEIRGGRSTPDGGGRAGVTTAVSME